MIIYSFPYAAGGSHIFNVLKSVIKEHHEIISIEYPGHGKRISEKLLDSVEEMALDAIKHISFQGKYSLLGYSMGAMVVFEILRIIMAKKLPPPANVYLCALEPTICDEQRILWKDISDIEIFEALKQLNGTPEEFFENEELIDLILPIVRNDFHAAANYRISDFTMDRNVSSHIIYSNDEDEQNISNWRGILGESTSFHHIDGTHFFIHNEYNLSKIKEIIIKSLK